jgi:hypothetical protein
VSDDCPNCQVLRSRIDDAKAVLTMASSYGNHIEGVGVVKIPLVLHALEGKMSPKAYGGPQ